VAVEVAEMVAEVAVPVDTDNPTLIQLLVAYPSQLKHTQSLLVLVDLLEQVLMVEVALTHQEALAVIQFFQLSLQLVEEAVDFKEIIQVLQEDLVAEAVLVAVVQAQEIALPLVPLKVTMADQEMAE
jgi:hypothetical protein